VYGHCLKQVRRKVTIQKDSFYEDLEQVIYHLPKYHMKILLGDFNAKEKRRENIFKPTTGNDSLHQDSNDNGVGIVNFATSINLVVKSKMFLHRDIQSTPEPLLMGRLTTRLITY
jgi:hypothetical protein